MAKVDVAALTQLLGGAVLLIDELEESLLQAEAVMRTVRQMINDDSIDVTNHDRLLLLAVRNWKRDYAKTKSEAKQVRTEQCGPDSADAPKQRDSTGDTTAH